MPYLERGWKISMRNISSRPQLIEIKGQTFADRLRYVVSFNEITDTNPEAVFDLIPKTVSPSI